MAPIRKLNDGMEGLKSERYDDLRKVKRRDYHDSGGAQRQFQELVEEFGTEEGRKDAAREKTKDSDKVDIERERETKESGDAGKRSGKPNNTNRKASHRVKNTNPDDEPVGGKLDING